MSPPEPETLIQRRVPAAGLPSPRSLRHWAGAAREGADGALTVRIVDRAESQALNAGYRGKDRPTNVLSFPADSPIPGEAVLGDIVICAPVVAEEAAAQGKSVRAHWAHMVVHGVLHLRGFDHIKAGEARRMEARERAILAAFGFPDPYAT